MAKKKKKFAIPKTIAGMKVPKRLRKSSLVRNLLSNRMGRQIMADALVAGAGAAATILIAERKEAVQGAEAGLRKTRRGVSMVGEAMESAVGAMFGVVSEAAGSILPKKARRKMKRDREDRRDLRPH
jgi:hypothetical protein